MTQSSTVRAVGGLSAIALTAGFAATVGAGIANAAPGSVSWSDGNSTYTRTISNVTPAEGEIITSTTTFGRKSGFNIGNEKLEMVKDVHPACLTYVDGSVNINGNPYTNVVANADNVVLGVIDGPALWETTSVIVGNGGTAAVSFSYKVGADCARGVALQTWMEYDGNKGAGIYTNKGPTISVSKNVSTAALAAVTGAKVGQSVQLSATVTGGVDGDIVEFYDGTTKLGEGALSSGAATFAWTPAADGQYALTAKFLGTATANESVSAVQNVEVAAADVETTTTLTVPATAVVGEDVTVEATIAPATAAGQVQFKDGAANIGDPVTVVDGKASITRRFPEAGTHSFTASFVAADGYLNSDSAPAELTVKDADFGTTTTVLEPVTATVGVPVNLSATVMPIPDAGQVKFTVDGVEVGLADVGTGDGVATLSHTFDTVGTANVVAEFVGTAGFTPSTSTGFAVTVKAVEPDREATTTTLVVSGPAVAGQAMTFTATVAPAGVNGTVQFKAGTTEIGAPVAVVDGVATLSYTFDTPGTYGITAVFTGGEGFQDSVSGPTVIGIADASDPGTPGGGSVDLGSLSGILGG